MAGRNPKGIKVPTGLANSDPAFEVWQALAAHPLINGQFYEDITLNTTGGYTRIPHSLGRKYRGFLDVRGVGLTEDQRNTNKEKEIWLYQEAAPVFLDYQEVTGADVAAVTFSGLRGDTDLEYWVRGYVVNNSGGALEYHLRPNGASTNLSSVIVSSTGAAVTTATSTTGLWVANTSVSAWFEAHLFAPTGQDRAHWAISSEDNNGRQRVFTGNWDETTTEITSLQVFCSSTEIGVGSKFWLYARTNRATKASFWLF